MAVGFAGGPGFQALAADLADHHLLLDQVQAGLADVQFGQFDQRAAVGGFDGKGREGKAEVAQLQLGAAGQAQLIVGGQVEDAFLQVQGQGVAHVGPDAFELAIAQLQMAAGADRAEAQGALPFDLTAIGAGGLQTQFGIVVGQGAEVAEAEVEAVVDEFDRLAGAQVFEMHGAGGQDDALDA